MFGVRNTQILVKIYNPFQCKNWKIYVYNNLAFFILPGAVLWNEPGNWMPRNWKVTVHGLCALLDFLLNVVLSYSSSTYSSSSLCNKICCESYPNKTLRSNVYLNGNALALSAKFRLPNCNLTKALNLLSLIWYHTIIPMSKEVT